MEPARDAFDQVIRMRIALSVLLAVPLAFFAFLVWRFQELWSVLAIGAGVYLYILLQFFWFQNPKVNARPPEPAAPAPTEPEGGP